MVTSTSVSASSSDLPTTTASATGPNKARHTRTGVLAGVIVAGTVGLCLLVVGLAVVRWRTQYNYKTRRDGGDSEPFHGSSRVRAPPLPKHEMAGTLDDRRQAPSKILASYSEIQPASFVR